MKKIALAVTVITLSSLNCSAETTESIRDWRDEQTCKALLDQHAYVMEKDATKRGTFEKVTWVGDTSVILEYSDKIETLTCNGSMMHHQTESK